MGPLLNGTLVTKHIETAKVLSAFFVLVFVGKTYLQESHAAESSGKAEQRRLSLDRGSGREHLKKQDIHKSSGFDEMHPQMLPNLTLRPLLITLEKNHSHLK